jgi:hypothetical protein
MLGRCVSRTLSRKGLVGHEMSIFRDRLMPLERNAGVATGAAMTHRDFQTWHPGNKPMRPETPGSKAFADCEADAIKDLFHNFAKTDGDATGIKYLDLDGVRNLLNSIGERPDERTLRRLYKAADFNGDGIIELHVSITEACSSFSEPGCREKQVAQPQSPSPHRSSL